MPGSFGSRRPHFTDVTAPDEGQSSARLDACNQAYVALVTDVRPGPLNHHHFGATQFLDQSRVVRTLHWNYAAVDSLVSTQSVQERGALEILTPCEMQPKLEIEPYRILIDYEGKSPDTERDSPTGHHAYSRPSQGAWFSVLERLIVLDSMSRESRRPVP